MALARLRRSLIQMEQRVLSRIRSKASPSPDSGQLSKEFEKAKWQPQLVAYRLLGKKVVHFLPLFRDMNAGLRKSGMLTSFKPYVSLTLLASLIIAVVTLFLVPPLLHFAFQTPLFPSLLFGVGGSLLAGALTIMSFYMYPLYRADVVKRNLDDNMTFATGYLAILAGAGVPPNSMFRSLSKIPQKLAIIDESRIITRDVELFGTDMITALENASKRTPSEKFKELLEGFIATIHSGGSLMTYLLQRSRQSMRFKRIVLRRFSDTLGMLSEVYVTLLVAGPLIFVVMLAVMAMMSGAGFGVLNPALLLLLLTYIGIPVGSVVFLIILDAVMPKW
jgi:flagellar protein FlaJ